MLTIIPNDTLPHIFCTSLLAVKHFFVNSLNPNNHSIDILLL